MDHFGLKEGLRGARNRGTHTSIESGIGIVAGDAHAQINGFSPLSERGGRVPTLGFTAEEERDGEQAHPQWSEASCFFHDAGRIALRAPGVRGRGRCCARLCRMPSRGGVRLRGQPIQHEKL